MRDFATKTILMSETVFPSVFKKYFYTSKSSFIPPKAILSITAFAPPKLLAEATVKSPRAPARTVPIGSRNSVPAAILNLLVGIPERSGALIGERTAGVNPKTVSQHERFYPG